MAAPFFSVLLKGIVTLGSNSVIPSVPAHEFLVIGLEHLALLQSSQHGIESGFRDIHRLPQILSDLIAVGVVVLNDGNIEASGRQEVLMDECPLYNRMWKAHIGAKNWAAGKA